MKDINYKLIMAINAGDYLLADKLTGDGGKLTFYNYVFDRAIHENNQTLFDWLIKNNYKLSRQNLINLFTKNRNQLIKSIISKLDMLDFIDLLLNETNVAFIKIIHNYRNLGDFYNHVLNNAYLNDDEYLLEWVHNNLNWKIKYTDIGKMQNMGAKKCYTWAINKINN